MLAAPAGAVGDAPIDQVKQELSTSLAWVAAAEQAGWSLIDMINDFMAISDAPTGAPDDANRAKITPKKGSTFAIVWDGTSLAYTVAGQTLWWPNDSGLWIDGVRFGTTFHGLQSGMWLSYWVPFLTDFVVWKTGGTFEEGAKWVNTCAGLLTLGLSIGASVTGVEAGKLNGYDVAGNILGPISYATQFLLLEEWINSSVGGTAALQLCNDLFTGEGCALAMFMSLYEG
jgi:hypothetical protein